MRKVNVIYAVSNGITQDVPFVTTDSVKAEAHFDLLAEKYAGDDCDFLFENEIDYSEKIIILNNYLNYKKVRIEWYVDVEVNTK